jgi:hypothetical protein
LKEEHIDKTVYKITKGRSPVRQPTPNSFEEPAVNRSLMFEAPVHSNETSREERKRLPLRMTRSVMKSMSSVNSDDSSSSEDEESSNPLDFMKSNLSKENKK